MRQTDTEARSLHTSMSSQHVTMFTKLSTTTKITVCPKTDFGTVIHHNEVNDRKAGRPWGRLYIHTLMRISSSERICTMKPCKGSSISSVLLNVCQACRKGTWHELCNVKPPASPRLRLTPSGTSGIVTWLTVNFFSAKSTRISSFDTTNRSACREKNNTLKIYV